MDITKAVETLERIIKKSPTFERVGGDKMTLRAHAYVRWQQEYDEARRARATLSEGGSVCGFMEELADVVYYAAVAWYAGACLTARQAWRAAEMLAASANPVGFHPTMAEVVLATRAKYETRFITNARRKDRRAEYAAIAAVVEGCDE